MMAANRPPSNTFRRFGSLLVPLTLMGVAGCNMSSGGGGGNPPPGQAISVAITSPANPNNVNVQADIGMMNFTATVSNDSQNGGVSWKLTLNGAACSANTCGSLSNSTSSSGVAITYTAPTVAPASSVTLTAASVTDSTKSANATINVTPAVAVAQPSPSNANAVAVQADIGSQQFSVTVNNDAANAGVNWTLGGTGCSGSACGTLSATSSKSGNPITYTAPSVPPNPATVTLTATSITDGNQKANWTITITAAVSIAITSPANPNVNVQADIGAQNFIATVANAGQNPGVTWTLAGAGCNGATCGTLSSSTSTSGTAITYTAPAIPPNPATVTLTATSVTDKNQTAPATITVTPAVSVSASASSPAVPINLTAHLTATVTNDVQNKGVNWTMTISGAACTVTVCGSLSSSSSFSGVPVTYTAPASVPPAPATITFTATSVLDPNKSSPASVTITLPVSVSVASVPPTNVPFADQIAPRQNYPLQVNQVQGFVATLQNDPNGQGVIWSLSTPSIAGCNSNPIPAACGLLSGITNTTVTYTALGAVPAGQNPVIITLTATSVADPNSSASETIPVSQGIPAAAGWFEIPNTQLYQACPTNPEIQGTVGCAGVLSAWGGGAGDTKRNRLLIAGAGHQNYFGNEVYALDLNSSSPTYLQMTLVSQPTIPSTGIPACLEDWGSPPQVPSAPSPRETYGDLAYAANVDKFWLFGGAPATNFEPCRSNGMWTLDLSASPAAWTQLNQTLAISNPPGPNGIITLATATTPCPSSAPSGSTTCPWMNGPTATDINYSDYDSGSATRPSSGLIYSFFADANILASYDPTQNKLTSLAVAPLSPTVSLANGLLDPNRNIFMIVGQGTLAWFDLNTSPPTFHNPYNFAQPPSSSVYPCLNLNDPTAVANVKSPGLAYDSVSDRVVGWAGGNNIYVIDTTQATSATPALTCHVLTNNPGGGPQAQQSNGTFGRFRYFPALDLFVIVNDWQQNAFTFRPANPLP